MKLYVLRHGETSENTTGMLQGNMDTLLDEKGMNQAIERREDVKNAHIELVISSPRQRTIKTAELAAPGIPIVLDDRLRSRDHGEFEGKSRNEINLEDYWNIKKNVQYERAESVMDLYNRVEDLLKEIKERYDGKNVMIVTHSGITRILYYYFNGMPEDGNLMGYQSTNCSFEEYDL